MLSWTYGRCKKNEYEVKKKINQAELSQVISNKEVSPTNGICFFSTDLVNALPPILRHYVNHGGYLHEIMVIVTIRTLPVQTILPEELFVVGELKSRGRL